jgi:hypothetical protein
MQFRVYGASPPLDRCSHRHGFSSIAFIVAATLLILSLALSEVAQLGLRN